MPESVHLCDFPLYDENSRLEKLEAEMDAVQIAASLGHALRKEHKLKVRQPLAMAHLISRNPRIISFLQDQQHLIADELNVKEIVFGSNESDFVKSEIQAKLSRTWKNIRQRYAFGSKGHSAIRSKRTFKTLGRANHRHPGRKQNG